MKPRHLLRAGACGMLIMAAWLSGQGAQGQQAPGTHTIFMTAVEIKGSTTADKLAPPAVNPADLSKGYAFKGPGEADKTALQRWESIDTSVLHELNRSEVDSLLRKARAVGVRGLTPDERAFLDRMTTRH